MGFVLDHILHQGEIPHLDVIVEDEQLSLAIGRRGQNVRLAAELIKCKIDVKGETDVKDEVAGALAKMLQTELGLLTANVFDLKEVAGVGEAMIAKLEEAEMASHEAILDASLESLQEIEGIGPSVAQALLDYAAEKKESGEADGAGLDPSSSGRLGSNVLNCMTSSRTRFHSCSG